MEVKLTELLMLLIDALILYMAQRNIQQTQKNRQAIESTKQISKKVYVALDAERVKKAYGTPYTNDDLISGELTVEE